MTVSNFKLGIGLPLTYHHVPTDFFESFVCMDKPPFTLIRVSGHSMHSEESGIDNLSAIRNAIVREAQTSGCSHLLMMDTDQVYPPDTIPRLLAHKLPIVGCLVHRRYPPFDPIMFRGDALARVPIREWEPGALVDVDVTGTGCVLFHMDVFRRVPQPWFTTLRQNGQTIGEDFAFCLKARRAGIPIAVDTSVTVGHLSQLQITTDLWRLYRKLNAVMEHPPAPCPAGAGGVSDGVQDG